MRIHRNNSRLRFRGRRRGGCLSPTLLLGIIIGGLMAGSWNWLGQWFNHSVNRGNTPVVDLNAAKLAFEQGDLNQAVDLSQRVLAAQPEDSAALVLLTRALIYRSYTDYNRDADRVTALQWAESAAADAPNDNDIQAVYALALQVNGNPAQAVEIAQKVLDRQPDHALARVAMAMAYDGAGSHNVALRESLQAVSSPGWRLDAHRALALSYSGVGDYDNAIASIERAIKLNDHLIPLYFERALYARQIGDADAASVAYFQVLALDPDNVKARFRLCELSSVLREYEAAIDYCQQVTQRAPSWADGWYQLGREYFLQGNFALAQSNLNRCSTLQVEQGVPVSERRFECWYLQGQAAEILGDCPQLVAIYNEYRVMAASQGLAQTWLYPPEGPPSCVTPVASTPLR